MNPIIANPHTGEVWRDIPLLFFCTLLYLLSALLYAWGTPSWFGLFPYSAGLRFLLAIEVYCLCCDCFLLLRIGALLSGRTFRFAPSFSASFLPVIVFSALVLLDFPIQTLKALCVAVDVAICLTACHIPLCIVRTMPLRKSMSLPALFLLSSPLLLVPAIPSIAIIAIRFLALAFFSVRAFLAIAVPVTSPVAATVAAPGDAAENQSIARRFALSPRETEVLALLCAGKTNDEIAEGLFVSLSTVKTHISSIFQKTGTRNRVEAAALSKKG